MPTDRGARWLPLLKRAVVSLAILLVIAYLTTLGMHVYDLSQQALPIHLPAVLGQAGVDTYDYLFHHPPVYIWHKETTPALLLVLELFFNSAGLLAAALLLATLIGGGLGLAAAWSRRRSAGPLLVLVSILGVSLPSFLLAMLLWVLDFKLYPALGLKSALLPPTGFGWDAHMVMPVLVLCARPLAQIMRVTYVSLGEVMDQEFMRAALARGASGGRLLFRHALRNVLIPVLTTMGTSLRFSLASLPVVESFFLWPGVGLSLLQAMQLDMPALVIDLIVSLGLMFLLVNLLLEVLYPWIDARLRRDALAGEQTDELTWNDQVSSWRADLRGLFSGIGRLAGQRPRRPAPETAPAPAQPALADTAPRRLAPGPLDDTAPLRPVAPAALAALADTAPRRVPPANLGDTAPLRVRTRPAPAPRPAAAAMPEVPYATSGGFVLRRALTNLPLLLGSLMVLALLALALVGRQLTGANPFETHNVMTIDGTVFGAPFEPSSAFPWGSDAIGRDLQALVLAGARQTLALALIGMLARVVIGVCLGMLAGWWQRSWLDQLINAVIAVWAAFPVTLFAMILILALGIQRGIGVFVIALCVVGWGEIAQFTRGQVIAQKPRLHIEAARSVGARQGRILVRHILPQILPTVLVMAVLEMGGILMLLAELGFLNIFLGGGYKVELVDESTYFFSDIPEWGALLANIRAYWRSYPWMAWYPGLAFFLSIFAFNVWGEGLRRFLDETRFNVSRLFNRFSLPVMAALVLAVVWMLRSNAPIEMYRSQAMQFDARRAGIDIAALSTPQMQGRQAGTPGGDLAAEYIAQRMAEIGLLPGGEGETYFQPVTTGLPNLTQVPQLRIPGASGQPVYRQDYVEYTGAVSAGEGQGAVVGLYLGPPAGDLQDTPIRVGSNDLSDKILLVRQSDVERMNLPHVAGFLIVCEGQDAMQRRYLLPNVTAFRANTAPRLCITPQLADRLLAPAGSSLEQMQSLGKDIPPDAFGLTAAGAQVAMAIHGPEADQVVTYTQVIGYIPGDAALMSNHQGAGLDNQVILISAYYDGLGQGPDGALYPGANDNASGVAALLEMARVLQHAEYRPDKTILFVAWAGGERGESLSVKNIMNAKRGFLKLTIEAVVELSGMAGGNGDAVVLEQGSSYRLVTLFEESARHLGLAATTRGRGPHADLWARRGFGGRDAMSAYVSWDGSDELAHTVDDTMQHIDLEKLRQSGQLTLLAVSVMSRETEY
ncbi:MAG: ABC transporter permease subunit [Anaerolineaceae bacterium]|nr:ABC transporter permease subunit [Anaerolineaceae bacterium]